jgi:peptide/nickel transport system permease protein
MTFTLNKRGEILLGKARGKWLPRAGSRYWENKSALVGLAIMAVVVVAAIGADAIMPHFYGDQDLMERLKPPVWNAGGTWDHILGTDSLGRDVWSRMIYGARVSMLVSLAGVFAAGVVGVLLGLLAGYYGKFLGGVIMRITDVQLTFPPLLLAIAIMAVLKPSLMNVIIVLSLRSWVIYARTVRGLVLSEKTKDYVLAALSIDASNRRIMFRHILPNIMGPIIVISTFQLPALILTEASLSFLGLGVQPPVPSWGEMLNSSRDYISSAWWLVTFPGVAIMITVLGGNLLGDGLRDRLDPRSRTASS